MPIYEYECEEGHRVEKVRGIGGRNDLVVCPTCGREMKIVMSVPGWWKVGWEFLKWRKSEPAPEGSGYYPKWDD
jgi:putative FmdB family regulatory protein